VVEELEARAVAEPQAQLSEPSRGQPVARRQEHRLILEPAQDVANSRSVVGVSRNVAPVPVDQASVGRAIDVVDRAADRREAAGEERLAEPFRRDRQVGHRGEATETLAEDAPALDAELLTDPFGVAHDRIGPEVRQVGCLRLRRVTRDHRADRG